MMGPVSKSVSDSTWSPQTADDGGLFKFPQLIPCVQLVARPEDSQAKLSEFSTLCTCLINQGPYD